MKTTVGQLLINEALPPDLRDYGRVLDKKSIRTLLRLVADRYPDRYNDIAHALMQLGGEVSTIYGGKASLSLDDLRAGQEANRIRRAVERGVQRIVDGGGSGDDVIRFVGRHAQALRDTNFKEQLAAGNALASQVNSGARGNPVQFSSISIGDAVVQDHKDNLIPIPLLHSYAEGLDPVEYWAGSYGARKGAIDTKLCLSGTTLVRMADGSVKAIRDIKSGDMVLGSDYAGRCRPVKVLKIFDNGERECYRYVFRRSATRHFVELIATEDHRVLAESRDIYGRSGTPRLRRLAEAAFGGQSQKDKFVAVSAYECAAAGSGCEIVSKSCAGSLPTFDLEVDHPDHMFVLESGLIVANSTPRGGFFAKQLALAAHRLVVTEHDCGTANGIPVDSNDPDSVGALLAKPYGDHGQNTVVTPQVLKALKRHKTIVVRSPLTCQAKGGVCARCAGVREHGDFPEIGDNVGLSASAAVAEPVSQSALSSKHSGGIAGAGPTAAGFDAINSLVQVPKQFREGAAIASTDGTVEKIEQAPQGGIFITISGKRHYAAPGMKPHVKKGDVVEAGDVLSAGLPNPAEIVKHKGIGAGRWHFMNTFRDTLRASKIAANRRNIELLARGLINHARITSDDGPPDALPDDIVEFNTITKGYTPRPGTKLLTPTRARGMYLEEPVLHYSIGTRITPRVAAELPKYGVKSVKVHSEVPSFEPEMVRAVDTLSFAPDWMVRLGGFNLKKNLLESVHRGRVSREHQESYIPALARGVELGRAPAGAGVY